MAKRIQRATDVAARPTRTKTAATAAVLSKKLIMVQGIQESPVRRERREHSP